MNKRLMMLEQLVADGSSDPFHRYALALEYKSAGRSADALECFSKLRNGHPDYLPTYMLAGTMLADGGQDSEARAWYEQGLVVARRQGDQKTTNELEIALAGLDA